MTKRHRGDEAAEQLLRVIFKPDKVVAKIEALEGNGCPPVIVTRCQERWIGDQIDRSEEMLFLDQHFEELEDEEPQQLLISRSQAQQLVKTLTGWLNEGN